MIFELTDHGASRFSSIHPVLEGILRTLAIDPWERCPEGSARLLPAPGGDEELLIDWQDHVQPELRQGFDSTRAVVQGDLATMSRELDETWSLEIPADHADAWLSTLNALRLALATEHGLTESELADEGGSDFSTPRGLALMQVNFFAFIQECLIRAMEADGE